MDILTLEGIKKLEGMAEKPKNWKEMVMNYLTGKETMIVKLKELGRDNYEQTMDYAKAIAIARRLGLAWRPNISR